MRTPLIALAIICGLFSLAIAAALTPLRHPPVPPQTKTQSPCCEFIAERTFETPEPWTNADRKAWLDKLAHDTERDLIIQRFHDRAPATPPPSCGSFLNPCHTVIDQ